MTTRRLLALSSTLCASLFAFAACSSDGDAITPPLEDAGASSGAGGQGTSSGDGSSGGGSSGQGASSGTAAPSATDGVKNGDETDVDCGGSSAPSCADGLHCAVVGDCASQVCAGGVCVAASHGDGVKNGDETDVDCGGASAPRCADGLHCAVVNDCASSVCTDGVCAAPTPADGVQNGDETDVDCGGSNAPRCADGLHCAVVSDCVSSVCTGGVCAVPTHSDGVKNGDETGVDCGGPSAPNRCADGGGCGAASDCSSSVCLDATHTCAPPSATDGVKNGDETDVDCGGAVAAPCAVGLVCALPRDCVEGVCGGDARCSAPTHSDGVKNGDETGVDCGGPTAPNRCATGGGCAAASDCGSGVCSVQGACLAPTHADGVKNGNETGVDCGGPTAPNRCAVGGGCAAGSDCVEGVCGGNQLCAAPSNADGVKNGSETDVDCGGASGKTCAVDKLCAVHADCASDGCDSRGRCALARSCTAQNGGRTCGAGEVANNTAQHESCCETIPVQTAGNVKLDKYNITAGRMRAFVERTGGDIKGWIEAHTPAWWNAGWTEYLPTGLETPIKVVDGVARQYGVYGHLGGNYLYNQDGSAGCWSGPSGTGAPTYWIAADARERMSPLDGGNRYAQAVLDQKALNCANVLMLAAFCAWDGGRLPTITELDAAWGAATYPWGAAPNPAGYDSGYPNAANLMRHNGSNGNISQGVREGDPLRANYVKNYPQTGALWNLLGGGVQGNDLAFHIAPPGRFPAGAGPFGHQDLAGSVFNVTSTFSGNVANPTVGVSRWSRSGSWETAHPIPYGAHTSPLLRKYWAQGGRCVKN